MLNYRDLQVWQRSHRLAVEVYRLTEVFPKREVFGLTAQLRRAATSVPTNIVEGSKRRQSRDSARFINIAEGSLAETEYLLILSYELGFLTCDPAAILAEITEISKMLHGLHRYLSSKAS
jgi:four helix bundle protein